MLFHLNESDFIWHCFPHIRFMSCSVMKTLLFYYFFYFLWDKMEIKYQKNLTGTRCGSWLISQKNKYHMSLFVLFRIRILYDNQQWKTSFFFKFSVFVLSSHLIMCGIWNVYLWFDEDMWQKILTCDYFQLMGFFTLVMCLVDDAHWRMKLCLLIKK